MSFVYLASPYSHDDPDVVEERVRVAGAVAARMMEFGVAVFSPVVHSHYICDHLPPSMRYDHEFWMTQDLAVLKSASKLVVLQLKGWKRSRGVAREIAAAEAVGIPVVYVKP